MTVSRGLCFPITKFSEPDPAALCGGPPTVAVVHSSGRFAGKRRRVPPQLSGCHLPLRKPPWVTPGWLNPFAMGDGVWFHEGCAPRMDLPTFTAQRGPIRFLSTEWSNE